LYNVGNKTNTQSSADSTVYEKNLNRQTRPVFPNELKRLSTKNSNFNLAKTISAK
jgi:hypothetical protein